jgi:hypothetical protein
MRMGVRSTRVLALASLVLGVSASSGAAAIPKHAPILGVVPHAGTTQAFQALQEPRTVGFAPKGGPLFLHESPCTLSSSVPCWVMRTNTVYAIYWLPSGATACGGSPCSFAPNYESLINQYFADVAAASGRTDNVYSATTQYYDGTGPISYSSSFGGSYVDTTSPFPNDCSDGVDAVCNTDSAIQTEVQHVLSVKGWQPGTNTMFFVMTPDGVGSCFDNFTDQCTTNTYCAYHSGYVSHNVPVLYANEPYDATIQDCSDGTSPNGSDADAEINTISHEHNEAITDPWGNAWLDGSGSEIGDICAWDFGAATAGTVGADAYNQVINGHHYWLQQEYSNDGNTCVQHYLGIPANLGAPTVSGAAGQGRSLAATHGTWTQSPTSYAYQWQLCAANGTGCGNIGGATAATYALTTAAVGHTVRVEVRAHNSAGDSSFVPSEPTAVVAPIPTATAHPVLSGSAGVGKKLSTSTGSWNSTVTVAYQWLRCAADGSGCAPIPGATASSYLLAAADAGHTLEARVSGTNAAGTTTTLSNRSAVVVAAPGSRKAPHVSGRARVGKKLSGSHGSWTNSPSGYRYRWLRCNGRGSSCTTIGHATHPTYRLTTHDAGHRLRIRVTATNVAGSVTATSAPSARIRH